MKCNTFENGFPVDFFQDFAKMPCNRLPFPVRVGSQIDLFYFLCSLFQIRKIASARFRFLVLRSEIMFDIDSESPFGQIAYMTIGSFDNIVFP